MLNLEADAPESDADQGIEPIHHYTTVTEWGSFATAHCCCGWHGPARRARDRARLDASEHADADTT
ncbi:hypothetical protein NGB36_29405 [Streptomyces sp. RB6PN25]|uniref:Uncharacterized protein n=1 Tax=Streptomyces humicola TaxID=2953240 RepID=A0ABT1Q3S3_9ACTN|nr:hypothetical protein [Streptomyces humicola]MCQ4084582.1 hypothetical protein [Streptomyces humicola]